MARAEDVMNGDGDEITTTEAAVYDRQIRLWGLEAQNKLRHSRVLIVGMKGLGAEIAKNLVLCGLNSMVIVDNEKATKEDHISNFFLKDAVGKERGPACVPAIRVLNPLVKITCEPSLNEVALETFSLVILVDQPFAVVEETNEKCRSLGIRFIASSVYGWSGYAFFDFNGHNFLIKKEKPVPMLNLDGTSAAGEKAATTTIDDVAGETTTIEDEDQFDMKPIEYASFNSSMNVNWNTKRLVRRAKALIPCSYFPLRGILRLEEAGKNVNEMDEETALELIEKTWKDEVELANQTLETQTVNKDQLEYLLGPQLSATCAVVGGFVGQESIKTLMEGSYPLKNMFIYSAHDSSGRICNFPPK